MKERKDILSKITYACGDIYGGGSFIIVGLLLLLFLTKVEGYREQWAGIIIFVGKAWDAVTDPFMGMLSDRTKSKYGRRRPYFLLGSIPVFASWVMLWYSFGITGEAAKDYLLHGGVHVLSPPLSRLSWCHTMPSWLI